LRGSHPAHQARSAPPTRRIERPESAAPALTRGTSCGNNTEANQHLDHCYILEVTNIRPGNALYGSGSSPGPGRANVNVATIFAQRLRHAAALDHVIVSKALEGGDDDRCRIDLEECPQCAPGIAAPEPIGAERHIPSWYERPNQLRHRPDVVARGNYWPRTPGKRLCNERVPAGHSRELQVAAAVLMLQSLSAQGRAAGWVVIRPCPALPIP
jgi:hypothetical protein